MAIRVHAAEGSLIIADDPRPFWLFYSVFVAGGATVIYLSFTAGTTPAMMAAGAIIGLGNIAGGLYMIRREPGSRIDIDAGAGTVSVLRWGIAGRKRSSFPLGDLAGADVETTEHTDGGTVYRPRLRLTASRDVPVSLLWYQREAPSREVVSRVERFIKDARSVR